MDICTKTYIGQLSSVGHFGLRNTRNLSYCPIFGQLAMQMFRQCCVQHANGCRTMFCHTVQYLDSVVSNSPMVGLCCVQLSDGLWAECPIVQWSHCDFSNYPMQCYSLSFPIWGGRDSTRALQSSPFQNPGGGGPLSLTEQDEQT